MNTLTVKIKGFSMIMKEIILVIFVLLNFLIAQSSEGFNEKQFFQDLKQSYYNLNDTNLENLTALVTNYKMEEFAKEVWKNEDVFPLQLIWFKPDKLYLAQQGPPTIPENQIKEYQDIVEELKQRIKGILVDFDRFYITGLYESIKSDYKFSANDEQVWINFNISDNNKNIPIKYTMGLNGLCIEIEASYPDKNKRIIYNPKYKIIKTKWICTGWQVQTWINEEAVNGYILDIKYAQYQSIWIPTQIIMNWQRADTPGTTYYDIIKLKSYMFNQPLELQEGANPNQ